MFEQEKLQYDALLKEYNEIIVGRFDSEDFKDYNEILFSAHSCAIEGNSFTVDDTRELKEKGISMVPYGKSLFEAFEILDHFKAYEFLADKRSVPLNENLLKETHRILMEHTLSFRCKGAVPGQYTNTDMAAGDTVFGDHEKNIALVPKLLQMTQDAINNKAIHPIEISAAFHKYFIYLHPFRDGNGRMGRLISNFILSKFGHPNIIIESKNKNEYINALKVSHREGENSPIVNFFYSTAINRMRNEIEQKKNRAENFNMGLEYSKKNQKSRGQKF